MNMLTLQIIVKTSVSVTVLIVEANGWKVLYIADNKVLENGVA